MSGCRAAIVGVAGTALGAEERALFLAQPPAGFILFTRNCAEPDQLRALTAELKALFPERWVPIMVDQEGGRVQRLATPCWPSLPALRRIGELAELDMAEGEAAARVHATAIAVMLTTAGLDVVCAPCLDLLRPETTTAIGDRALAADPALVGALGRVYAQTLLVHGVVPVIKHLPGHGRATIDSHLDLPRVDATRDDLEASDFLAFKPLVEPPLGQHILAMTAHIVFRAIDPDRPATQSPIVIEEVIRGSIGYRGLLLSDDLSMEALAGPIERRALASLEAGCDLALHCNGKLEELIAVLHAVPAAETATLDRLQALAPAGPRDVAALDDVLAELETRLGHGVVGV